MSSAGPTHCPDIRSDSEVLTRWTVPTGSWLVPPVSRAVSDQSRSPGSSEGVTGANSAMKCVDSQYASWESVM